jgi:hypothetical protein
MVVPASKSKCAEGIRCSACAKIPPPIHVRRTESSIELDYRKDVEELMLEVAILRARLNIGQRRDHFG